MNNLEYKKFLEMNNYNKTEKIHHKCLKKVKGYLQLIGTLDVFHN